MPVPPSDTLVSLLRTRFRTHGDERRFIYLAESGRELVEHTTTYRDLDRGAREIAAWLHDEVRRQEPVVLLYPPGAAFWSAFLGCLYSATTAVPVPVPHDNRSLERLEAVLRDCGSALILTTASLCDTVSAGVQGLAHDIRCVPTDAQPLADGDTWTMPSITPDDIAFLQYTSGSTGLPKGVVVTHRNILHNEAAISRYLGIDDSWKLVGWVPHFHDLGLISVIGGLRAGADVVIMSPLSFLKQPVRLLQAISRYRATITAAPNFAYDLIARRVTEEQLRDIDLSTLRIAFNGAEPIRHRTYESVTKLLGRAGFSATAMRPAYGLAETTLFATATPASDSFVSIDADADALELGALIPGTVRTVRLASSGAPVPGIEVSIVDPVSLQSLPDGQVGEIWLRSDSVAAGYYKKSGQGTFGAVTAEGAGPYLRTGDLGAIRAGHLFVTGRRKDLVIVNGRNLYPHDIEDLVQSVHPAVSGARGVAVAVDAGEGERLVILQSLRLELLDDLSLEQLTRTIRSTVARELEVSAPSVVLLGHHGIHMTTSGKPQRSSMRKAFLDSALDHVLHENIEPCLAGLRRSGNPTTAEV